MDMELEFETLRHQLPFLSEEECHRHLMEELPSHLAGWVVEEEIRRRITTPQVIVESPVDGQPGQLKDTLAALFNLEMLKVEKMKPFTFLLHLSDMEEVQKAFMANGAKVRGSAKPLKVQEVRRQMTAANIFTFLKYKVDGRERLPQKSNQGGLGPRVATPNTSGVPRQKQTGGAKA